MLPESAVIHLNKTDHQQAVQQIFNHYIANTSIIYETQLRDNLYMDQWFKARQNQNLPILGCVTKEQGTLLGFSSVSPFRDQEGYERAVETSVYLHPDFLQQKVGSRLLEQLIAECQALQMHSMVAIIDSQNTGSIMLHKKFDFKIVGQLQEIAQKNSQWFDVYYMQKNI